MLNQITEFRKTLLSTSIATACISFGASMPVMAQAADDTEVIQVRGIRGSLQESMNIKREAVGVVDAISAEDIGKFPDSNLAESLQRITGVSIERDNGEGSKVTVRGFGAANNLVLLNGRMMPAASAKSDVGGASGGASRAFDFGNLASESVRAVEVYKTGKANISTGGIGATINIVTARPLSGKTGLSGGAQIKAMHDTTNVVGDDVTPELSGIVSFANDNKTWGVALTASHQERHSGLASAGSTSGWFHNIWQGADGNNYGNFQMLPGGTVENAPEVGQLYSRPKNIRYIAADTERERTNAQLTLEFSPSDNLTARLDYTYAKNETSVHENLSSVWRSNDKYQELIFDDEPVATAVYASNVFTDFDMKDLVTLDGQSAQTNELGSIGVNFEYFVNDDFKLTFDYHDSTMESTPGNVGGIGAGSVVAGVGANIGSKSEFDFRGDFPALSVLVDEVRATDDVAAAEICAGLAAPALCDGNWTNDDMGTNWSRIFDSAQTVDITQAQLNGSYEFSEGRFDFGIETRSMEMQQIQGSAMFKNGHWGFTDPGILPASDFGEYDLFSRFEDYDTSNAVGMKAFSADAVNIVKFVNDVYDSPFATYANINPTEWPNATMRLNGNRHVIEEDTFSAYAQYELAAEIGGMETTVLAGIRYEKTDVISKSLQDVPSAISWDSATNFRLLFTGDLRDVSEEADYDYLLPSLDLDLSITDDLKARMSFGQTIARAQYNNLRAAKSVGIGGNVTLLDGEPGSASAQNPGLVPLLSNNVDVSLEYYFDDTSYVSVGYFDKRVDNFIGNEESIESHFGLTDPTLSDNAKAALAALQAGGHEVGSKNLWAMTAILNDPIEYPEGAAGFSEAIVPDIENRAGGVNAVIGGPSDPLQDFRTTRPVNSKTAHLYGAEFAAQHFFGNTGFGLSANYTIVRGDVNYDPTIPPGQSQFALPGLSDTANLVAMYEKDGWQARVAYNWRDDFYAGGTNDPTFVEAFDQIDMTVSYDVTDSLVVAFQGINVTGEDARTYARSKAQTKRLDDLGARYMLSTRYSF